MEAKAIAKTLRIAPRKARLVVDLIRGKHVDEAEMVLKGFSNKASVLVEKVLNSAVANAVNNYEMDREKLFVKEIYVNEGQTMKRIRFGSRSNIDPIKKRTSHIIVVVSDEN